MATVIIAEAGVNHNGDLSLALELVDAADDAGAHVVKFQTFSSQDLTTSLAEKASYQLLQDGQGTQREMLQTLELSQEEHKVISQHCKKRGISFLSTAFGIPELNFLLELGIGAIKVPSGEITHLPLLECMAQSAFQHNLPVYMSTGMSTLSEIEAAMNVFLSCGVSRSNITIMHCLSAYPAPFVEVNLNVLKTLSDTFQSPVGYSDHTLGISASVVAVALGAKLIEKHITLNRHLKGPDHSASLEPAEFKQMVESIHRTELLLGTHIKQPQQSELNTRSVARRSIRASQFIPAGTIFQHHHFICQRPADGLSPMQIPDLLGRPAMRSFNRGDLISHMLDD